MVLRIAPFEVVKYTIMVLLNLLRKLKRIGVTACYCLGMPFAIL